jgi:hypothetical protein
LLNEEDYENQVCTSSGTFNLWRLDKFCSL